MDEESTGMSIHKSTRALKALPNRRERGYVLVTMGFSAFALFAALGLAVDIGRMFVAKNETQAYTDAAAMAATLKLNGATTGTTAASNAVANSTNAWNMDTSKV